MARSAIKATGPMTAPAIQTLDDDDAGGGVGVLVSLAVVEELFEEDAVLQSIHLCVGERRID
jgi:hypothetical protein